jgi:hypothetical protein
LPLRPNFSTRDWTAWLRDRIGARRALQYSRRADSRDVRNRHVRHLLRDGGCSCSHGGKSSVDGSPREDKLGARNGMVYFSLIVAVGQAPNCFATKSLGRCADQFAWHKVTDGAQSSLLQKQVSVGSCASRSLQAIRYYPYLTSFSCSISRSEQQFARNIYKTLQQCKC